MESFLWTKSKSACLNTHTPDTVQVPTIGAPSAPTDCDDAVVVDLEDPTMDVVAIPSRREGGGAGMGFLRVLGHATEEIEVGRKGGVPAWTSGGRARATPWMLWRD
jgi:hypothetical protein